MGINARPSVHPRVAGHVASSFSGFEICSIQIIDPNTMSGNDNFEPWTNATGSTPAVVWSGRAQMQIFRQTLTVEVPAGGMTQVRSARFTIHGSTVPVIPRGFIVRVTSVDPAGSQDAMSYQYVVTSALEAPTAFSSTLECEVDMGVIL